MPIRNSHRAKGQRGQLQEQKPFLPRKGRIPIDTECGRQASHFQTEINFYGCQKRTGLKASQPERGVLLCLSSLNHLGRGGKAGIGKGCQSGLFPDPFEQSVLTSLEKCRVSTFSWRQWDELADQQLENCLSAAPGSKLVFCPLSNPPCSPPLIII